MTRRKSSYLPTVLIALALAFAVYFAVFGKATPAETDAAPTAATEPVPQPQPEPEQPELAEEPVDEEPGETEEISLPADPQEEAWKEFDKLYRAGQWREARPVLAKLMSSDKTSDKERLALAQKGIEINKKLLVVQPDNKDVTIHEVQMGEVLTTIGRKYKQLNGAYGIIMVVNHMSDANRLRVGKKLRIPKGGWSLFIDKSMFRMWLMYEGTPFKEYEIAIGKNDKTPATTFTVDGKTPKPDWYPPANLEMKERKIKYGDPRNPLGAYWIAMVHDLYDGYGIHGTNDESVIGTAASNGCIRMHNNEVNEMASVVFKGMTVRIVE